MMNCSCAICCSRLEPSDDIFATNCGHIFHFPCLTQWLERSKTCPQCREKTNATKIHRLYFNISHNDTIKEDSAALQERIDNLQFQILLRDKDVTDFKAKAEKLQAQMKALRSEVLKLEAEVEHKNSAICAFKEQVKYYKQTYEEGKKYKEQAEMLKNKLNDLKNVQTLLTSTNHEADELISDTNDPGKLMTYISALKRELTVGLNNRKEYRMMIKQLKQELNKSTSENNNLKENLKKVKYLEDVTQRLKNENLELIKRLKSVISEDITEADSDKLLKLPKTNIFTTNLEGESTQKTELDEENEENSPTNRRFKVQNLISNNKKKMSRSISSNTLSSSSILAKKPRLAHNQMNSTRLHDEMYASDGLGGFSKIEQFPKSCSGAIKKKATTNGKTREIQFNTDSNNQSKIDYFVDLTNDNI